jgi:hypothetical protein
LSPHWGLLGLSHLPSSNHGSESASALQWESHVLITRGYTLINRVVTPLPKHILKMPSSELFFIHQSSDDIVEADVNAEAAGHQVIICTFPHGFVGSMGQNWKPTMRDPSYRMWLGHNYHNWLFNIAMENGPFIDDVPSYKPPFMVGIFHGYVRHNQMVS